MRIFKDTESREWSVALTCSSAGRVRDTVRARYHQTDASGMPTDDPPEERPFDIVEIRTTAQTLQILRTDYHALAAALYAICMPQAESRGVSRDAFLSAMSGDALDCGREAIEDELVAFFPSRLRGIVSSLISKVREAESAATADANEKIRAAVLTHGASSGNTQESSESTPAIGL